MQQEERLQAAELTRLARVKHRTPAPFDSIGPLLVEFHKSVSKRQTKLAKIAAHWERVVPPQIFGEHCCLDAFSRGTLTVLVDTSSHLYQLKTLLLSGAQQQLKLACVSVGLRKIQLKRGKWYDDKPGDSGEAGGRELRF